MSKHIAHGLNGPCICDGPAPEGVDIYEIHKQYLKVLSNSKNSKFVVILGNTGLDAIRMQQQMGLFNGLKTNGTIVDKTAVDALLIPDRILSGVHRTKTAAIKEATEKYKQELCKAHERYNALYSRA